jgi:hypothetical protein
MTEEEAKNKWCPQTLASDCPDEINGREAVYFAGGIRCRGSECMAWRWDEPDGLAMSEMEQQDAVRPSTSGYCGLVGKP